MAKDDEKVVPTGIQLPKDIFHNLTNHQAQLDVSPLPSTIYRADV